MVSYLMYLPPTHSSTYLPSYLLTNILSIHLPINSLPTYLYFVTFVQPTYVHTTYQRPTHLPT
jgi:hypothetical protein